MGNITNYLRGFALFWEITPIEDVQSLYAMLKKSTAQITHSILPTHKPNAKNQKSYLLPKHNEINDRN
ncbi:hypothetical protein FHS59_002562 [Algoriphagus iocasae]|uniref:Uncharacterized protein n=1 Tax=Algoriphagus iocasae TaxID=1836499 RepID=A0A841MQE8_9BACT|nr:hypothetical protein [Algoriphagus iocasae]MBB6326934.1 hypothetical protein [Algoriphagus iocasae]